MKSTCKLIDKLNYDTKITITQLHADPKVLETHRERLTKIFKKDTKEQIDRKILDLVVRDNAFSAIMNIILKSFEFKIDKEDVQKATEQVKNAFTNLSPEEINKIGEQTVKRDLVFEQLAKLWDIFVTDDEVKESLNNYYKVSNQPIRDYLDDKAKFEAVRKMIQFEKINKEMLTRFKYHLELKRPEKTNQ